MGNVPVMLGDHLSCLRTRGNQYAISRGIAVGQGHDIDDAVLAATSDIINNQNILYQTLRISFSCKNLPNLDTFTRSDGMAVLYRKESNNRWSFIGMTEIVPDSLNPEWVNCFDIPYKFEET